MDSENDSWSALPENTKQDCIRYLKLMKRFNKNSDLVGIVHKKWMLENCDLPTELIPNELMDEIGLWL